MKVVAFLCQISLGVGSGARLGACMYNTSFKHYWYYITYIRLFFFTQQYLVNKYVAPSLLCHVPDNVFTTQVLETMISPNSGPRYFLLGFINSWCHICQTEQIKAIVFLWESQNWESNSLPTRPVLRVSFRCNTFILIYLRSYGFSFKPTSSIILIDQEWGAPPRASGKCAEKWL